MLQNGVKGTRIKDIFTVEEFYEVPLSAEVDCPRIVDEFTSIFGCRWCDPSVALNECD